MTSQAPRVGALRRQPLWAVIVAGGVITSISLGARSTFGLYLDPIADTIGTGVGPIALAVAVQNLIWGLSQPIAGAISDRYGAARTLSAGAVLYSLALVLLSRSTSTGTVLLSGGFLTGVAVGAASFSVVLSSVGRMVGPAQRSIALGWVSALGSLGQFIIVPVARRLLDSTSWQNTVLILAVIVLTLIAFTPVLKGRSADFVGPATGASNDVYPLRVDLARASRAKGYWLLNAGFFVCGFHVTFIATHLPKHAENLGISQGVGATALAIIGLFNVFGSLSAGFLGSKFSFTKLLAGIYALRAIVIGAFVLVPITATTTIIFGAAIGLLWLSTVPLTSAIVAQQFGPANSGALFGIVFLSHQLGAFLGAWLGGRLFDASGSYTTVWWIAVALGFGAMIAHLLLDESPLPPPTAADHRGLRLSPAGGMAGLAVVGLAASTVALAFDRVAGAAAPEQLPLWCQLV